MAFEVVDKRTSATVLENVVRLEKRIFPKHESMAETLVKEALKPQNALILALDASTSAVRGYVLCRRSGAGVGHIDKLAVAPAHRRQGVGRALLAFALAHLRTSRATSANLVVDVERVGAVALYQAAGFSCVATRADYYQPGRHALVMERSLLEAIANE